ncbi:MAG: bifunctional hydroxymethylpyrimidine kinase/phosphomethylpyrimidine kinase [Moorellales bacterium]
MLTVAGSDSGGGAGIEADLKTCTLIGVYATVALTAVTAQNTCEVRAVHYLPPDMVKAQIEAVLEDIGTDAVKTGMLGRPEIIEAVVEVFRARRVANLVVDPVMVAKSGAALLAPEAVSYLKERLLPLATVVTPNAPELAVLSGRDIDDEEGLRSAAAALWHQTGVGYVLAKGGHLTGPQATDWLYDGREFTALAGPRLEGRHTHGTGCTLSAALAAYLALGLSVPEAARRAKEFVSRAIARGLALGRGCGPVNPWAASALGGGEGVALGGPSSAGAGSDK